MRPCYTDLDLHVLLCQAPLLKTWTHGDLAAPHWRLYWNQTAGASVCPRDGKVISLAPGKLVLIPPEACFSTELTRPVRHLYIHFTTRSVFETAALPIQTCPVPAAIRTMLNEMVHRLEQEGKPNLRMSMLALGVLHYALAQVPPEVLQEDIRDRRVVEAIERMRQNLTALPDNNTLSAAARMNTNAFIRLFRENTGTTPQAYANRLRVEEACMRLVYSDKSIAEIAEALGFCDRYHFSRAFARLRGRGPASFRRHMTPAGQLKDMGLALK